MTPFRTLRLLYCAVTAAVVPAACSVPQAAPPPGPQAGPGAAGRPFKGALLYAGGDESSYVFTFPAGKLAGTIAADAFGVCSDTSGDVFFTQVGSIAEYAHGGTNPVATFTVPGTAYSCSVDPVTGKLAAVVYCFKRCGQEVLVIRPGGKRQAYRHVTARPLLYCAYDGSGNLFVDGYNGTQFALLELARGASRFAAVTLKTPIRYPAQIQWDGKDLAIETRINPAIYRVTVSGSTARVVGRTHLGGVGQRATQSWIAGGKIAVPTGPGTKRAIEVMFWNYPAGGNPTKVISGFIGGHHAQIDAVTFSFPPSSPQR